MVRNLSNLLPVPAFQPMKITASAFNMPTSRYPQLAGAHATLRKVRSDIRASLAADLAHEARLDIRQLEFIRPALAADRDVVAAMVIAAVDQHITAPDSRSRRSLFLYRHDTLYLGTMCSRTIVPNSPTWFLSLDGWVPRLPNRPVHPSISPAARARQVYRPV